MNIYREITSGNLKLRMTIQLTSEELYNAYCEKQFEYDREDIVNELDACKQMAEDIYGIPYEKITGEMIDSMAEEKRHQMDKYGLDWSYARDEAIKKILENEQRLEAA